MTTQKLITEYQFQPYDVLQIRRTPEAGWLDYATLRTEGDADLAVQKVPKGTDSMGTPAEFRISRSGREDCVWTGGPPEIHYQSLCADWPSQWNAGTTECRDFGVRDRRGRLIGGSVRRVTIVTTALPARSARGEHSRVIPKPPGTYYLYQPHALRDRKPFASEHFTKWYATEAEREQAVDRYFREANRRAQRVVKILAKLA